MNGRLDKSDKEILLKHSNHFDVQNIRTIRLTTQKGPQEKIIESIGA